ncbi:MAG: BMC domain-containing protein [Propionibacteriaceae bacterium]|nr:BMC domain-containing protein [Propionibacteriaceae bacterium]
MSNPVLEAAAAPTKQRIIEEFVPGKQVTLAHLIANPVDNLSVKLGLAGPGRPGANAIGILTITPSEAAIIGADVASKAAMVEIAFVDRFSGAVLITGDVQAVRSALEAVLDVLAGQMGFTPTPITKS